MAIARANSSVNMPSLSATSNTLTAPASIADGDQLLSLFGILNTSTAITEPTGWTSLFADTTSGTGLKALLRSRIAASEPGTYGWTFVASVKSAAFAAAYRGLHPTSPIAAALMGTGGTGTAFTTPAVDIPDGGWLVYGVLTKHAGSAGVATWTSSAGTETEIADAATNSGATDITLAAYDSGLLTAQTGVTRTLTSTMTETAAITFAIVLRPAVFVPPPSTGLRPGTPIR